jgi:hypothetical protein
MQLDVFGERARLPSPMPLDELVDRAKAPLAPRLGRRLSKPFLVAPPCLLVDRIPRAVAPGRVRLRRRRVSTAVG